MSMYDVTVIVATYKSDLKKILTTVSRVLEQKEVNYELIVSDDGSENNLHDEIKNYLDKRNFCDYRLIGNKSNVGTVRNYYNALKYAEGKYIFCTSPGDYLYDEMTLHDLVCYAEETKADAVFGDAVYYNIDDEGKIVLPALKNIFPLYPKIFNSGNSFEIEASFFFGNKIIGATILREKKTFIRQLEMILPYCKYVEDNTTTASMLLEHKIIRYYQRNIVFYEYGIGISTGKNEKWDKIIEDEFKSYYLFLRQKYPDNMSLSAVCYYLTDGHKKKLKMIKYPLISFICFINQFRKKRYYGSNDTNKTLLGKIISKNLL